MKIIRLISVINFLFILLLLSNAYAEYPTSTPQFIEPIEIDLSNFGATEGSNSSIQSQTTTTWTGGGDNELASNPENWSGGLVPQNGDHVVFDGTSIKNAIWNLLVTLYSLVIGSDYTGVVTISDANLTIGNFVQWTGGGGADSRASNSSNWSGNTLPLTGDNILFDSSSSNNCTWDISILPKIFVIGTGYAGTVTLDTSLAMTGSLTVSGGTLALNNRALSVDGKFLINPGGTINAMSSTMTVQGNWATYGIFNYGTSTVILAGTNQSIYGDTTFYNLIKTVTTADTLYFETGSTQTVLNNLTLQGSSNNLLLLRSMIDGQPWYINPQGIRNISFVDMRDSYNDGPVVIILDSIDSGNNTNMHFGEDCVCLPMRVMLSDAQIILEPEGHHEI